MHIFLYTEEYISNIKLDQLISVKNIALHDVYLSDNRATISGCWAYN